MSAEQQPSSLPPSKHSVPQKSCEYFPWQAAEKWLREGIIAGTILNKLMVTSWPDQERLAILEPVSTSEEVGFLHRVAAHTTEEKLKQTVQGLEILVASGGNYPNLGIDIAYLWVAFMHYGTSSPEYTQLHAELRPFMNSIKNTDEAVTKVMDGLWRSIGPAMDPIPTKSSPIAGGLEENISPEEIQRYYLVGDIAPIIPLADDGR